MGCRALWHPLNPMILWVVASDENILTVKAARDLDWMKIRPMALFVPIVSAANDASSLVVCRSYPAPEVEVDALESRP